MSKHKKIKAFVLAQAETYKKQVPKDRWVEEILLKGNIEVSGVWLQDVIDVLTNKHKKRKDKDNEL